jgi:predicted RNase H-like HicB family nuclease
MKYSAVIEEDKLDGGYIAYVPALKGCFTQADTLDELKKNILEAIQISEDEDVPRDIKS